MFDIIQPLIKREFRDSDCSADTNHLERPGITQLISLSPTYVQYGAYFINRVSPFANRIFRYNLFQCFTPFLEQVTDCTCVLVMQIDYNICKQVRHLYKLLSAGKRLPIFG